MFDSHCHLTDIDSPLSVLVEARAAQVTSLLCCGYNHSANAAVVALRRQCPGLPIALGIHPWFALEGTEGLRELLEVERPTALGEIGLDGKEDQSLPAMAAQERGFVEQLELAQRFSLPVTVHSRQAVARVVELLLEFSGVRGALHAYSGSFEQLERLLARGWMVGIGGAATRPKAHKYHRLVTRLPSDALLLETDSPSIGLEGVCPPDVRPHHVAAIAEAVARLRGVPVEQLIRETDDNARALFGVP
jgi:TatD DNase family protein